MGLSQRSDHQLYPFLHFAAITPPGGLHPLELTVHWFSWLPGHPLLNLSVADPTHVLRSWQRS